MDSENLFLRRIVRQALEEDIGSGDITTDSIIEATVLAKAEVMAKEKGVLAGIPVAIAVLEEIGRGIEVCMHIQDGQEVEPGDVVLEAIGPARLLLKAERTLLNFLMRLSGIATKTRQYVRRLEGRRTRLLDTRKTTPGLRLLEKYAVRVGGGQNHRFGLYDAVLIKNNHLAICGDIKEAVRRARRLAPMTSRIEVEVRNFEELRQALEAGADAVLFDHMTKEEIARALDYCNWKVITEASGNLGPDDVEALADIGVDFVSVGAITRSATWLDFSMRLKPLEKVNDAT